MRHGHIVLLLYNSLQNVPYYALLEIRMVDNKRRKEVVAGLIEEAQRFRFCGIQPRCGR